MDLQIEGIFNLCEAIITRATDDSTKTYKDTTGVYGSGCPVEYPKHKVKLCAREYLEYLKKCYSETHNLDNIDVALEQMKVALDGI